MAVLALSFSKVVLSPCIVVWNIFSFVLGNRFIMSANFCDIFNVLALLPFSGVICIIFLFVSRCCHCSLATSPILIPVSFSSCKSVAVLCVAAAIKESNSCSVGMNVGFSSCVYFGRVHVLPINLR